MGSTCFMNTILQTFIHNPLLKAYFLSGKHDRDKCPNRHNKDTPCMACEMDSLFRNFYDGKSTTPYGPSSFLYAMWRSQKHLAGYQQQDAHEFFISVLNELHNNCTASLNGTHPSNSHTNSNKHSIQSTSGQCKCIIHQVFGGVLQSDVTCLKCGNVTTACDPILDISLDIRSVTRSIPQRKPNRKTGAGAGIGTSISGNRGVDRAGVTGAGDGDPRPLNQPLSLNDCLNGYTLPERLGPNQYTCAACGNTFQEATKQLSMKRLPPVIAIQLKRFEHSATASTKIETFVRVPADLDMTPHTTRAVKSRDKLDTIPTYKYSLFAIVNHEGKIDTGHYKAFAKCRGQLPPPPFDDIFSHYPLLPLVTLNHLLAQDILTRKATPKTTND
eukprot:jgi/Hompol1/3017/HPOL_003090-RA